MSDLLDFSDRTVVITGAATGMGAETVRLLLDADAQVHAIDIAPVEAAVAASYACDLGDADAVAALATDLPGQVDVLMNCAGIPNGGHWSGLEVFKVNFLGLRCLTEALLPRIPSGGAVTHIASIAGSGWEAHAAELAELMETTGFTAGFAWAEAHAEVLGDGYFFSKEAIQYYTMLRAVQTMPNGVRMNSICPGVTDTKLMVDFRAGMGDAAIDMTAQAGGAGRLAEAHEMAPAMLFLSHPTTASYINGVNLPIDGGFTAAMTTNQVDFAKYLG